MCALCRWVPHQQFSEADDPDRMRATYRDKQGRVTQWATPQFISTVDPIIRRGSTSVTEIHVPGSDNRDFSFAKVVHDVFHDDECIAMISAINDKGFTPALVCCIR